MITDSIQVAYCKPSRRASSNWHKPVENAGQIPCAPGEPTPPRHIGAPPCAKLCDPAILCLSVLAGDKPYAAYRAASAPSGNQTIRTLQHDGCNVRDRTE